MVAHNRSLRRLALMVAAAIVIVFAVVWALAGMGSAARATPLANSPTSAGNRRHAARDAAALLRRVRLPAGAVWLAAEPAGDRGSLARPFSTPAIFKLVDRHDWWRVADTTGSVLAYLQAHVPAGARLTESGSMVPLHGKPVSGYVGFTWSPVPGILGSRELLVQAVTLKDGDTGVRADAQVQWIVTRPASERIPRGVHEVDVTRARPGEAPDVSLNVTQPRKIRALVSMIDRLEIVQPGAVNCPALAVNARVVTFTFRSRQAGAVLAEAGEPAFANEPTTMCDPMTFSVRGRQQTPLLGGARVVRAAGRLLGVRLHTRGP